MRKLLILIVIMVLPSMAFGAIMTLTWDAPTTRSDGSAFALTEVSAYTLYYDTVTPPAANKLVIPISASWPSLPHMTYTLTGLELNTLYYVNVTVTDQYGQESAPSSIASNTTPLPAPPSPPTNFAAPTVGVK